MNYLSFLGSFDKISDLAALLIILIAILLCLEAAVCVARLVMNGLSGTRKRNALGIETIALIACSVAGAFFGQLS